MKRRYHLCLLGLPLLLLFVLWAYFKVGQVRSNEWVVEPDGLSWKTKASELRATVLTRRAQDMDGRTYEITLKDGDGTTRYAEEVTVDHDYGGGGFVKGMQVDSDAEVEIVIAQRHAEGFYLDMSSGEVMKKAMSDASAQARRQIADWLYFNVPNPFAVGAILVLCLAYWSVYFPLFWVGRAIVRRVSRRA